jgi:hypothetical protein
MCEFIALRVLSVGDLVQQLRSDRAIENEVALEQLYLFDGFPPSNGSGTRGRGKREVLLVVVAVWILCLEGIFRLQDGLIIVVGVLRSRILSKVVVIGARRDSRLVRLIIVGIMVCLRVDGVLVARIVLLVGLRFVSFVVAVGVRYPFDGELTKRQCQL